MTRELRTLIELKDISGLEMDCHKCHAKFLYPLHGDSVRKQVHKCPSCSEPWFVDQRPSDAPDKLIRFLKDLETLSEDTDIFPTIRLCISLENDTTQR